MRSKVFKSSLCLVFLFCFQKAVAELSNAQELLETHRESRKTLEGKLQENKELLKKQLTAELLKLDHQAQKEGNLHLRLWTHRSIRRLDELGDNWLTILAEPFKRPDPIQQLFITTENTWNTLQSTAADRVLVNRKEALGNMEKLQVRLVQEDRIDEAVITRDIWEKLNQSKVDEKLHTKIIKQTPKEYQQRVQKLNEKAVAASENGMPVPPPDALFPFQADNPTFQAYLKGVKVESGGFFATPSAHIQIGNHPVYSGFRGVAMVAYYDNEIVLEDTFDTYAEQAESVRLSEEIGKLPYGAFVVLAVRDDATRRFTGSTQSSLYRLGATKGILGQPYRSSHILVGMKGLEMGGTVEMFGMEEQIYSP